MKNPRRLKLRRFRVECRTPERTINGQVLLFEGDTERHRIEHALVALGIYAPRGADRVHWTRDRRTAWIYEAGSDEPSIKLWQETA